MLTTGFVFSAFSYPIFISVVLTLITAAASGVFAARYAGYIKGTTAGTVTWNAGSSYT